MWIFMDLQIFIPNFVPGITLVTTPSKNSTDCVVLLSCISLRDICILCEIILCLFIYIIECKSTPKEVKDFSNINQVIMCKIYKCNLYSQE